MCTKNHNHMTYGFWERVRQTDFFVLLGHFLPFYSPKNPENQTFEKMKNTYEDVIILYMCTKNHVIWCMLPEIWVQHTIFCHFGSFFCPFTPLLAPKIKNWKKIRRYFLFHMCKINKDSWDIKHYRQKFLSFCAIFCPFIPPANQ